MTAFAAAVALTRREAFDALEACAEAERQLLRCGRPVEAAGIAAVFELLEDRLVLDPMPTVPARCLGRYVGSTGMPGAAGAVGRDSPRVSAGSKSSESEFTQ